MTGIAGWSAFVLALFTALLFALGWMEAHGFVSSDVTELWAKAIVQIGSAGRFAASDAFYPPVPFALTLAIQYIAGGTGLPTPFVLSAALGAAMLVLWLKNLWLTEGFSLTGSCIVVALLALNPYFLRALADGPETMFTIFGTWIYAGGIVNLRLTGNAPDMMKVAVGLLIVAMSDNYGLMISLGALPFLIVAARPSMIASSSFGYLFAMFYPVAAALASLFFVAEIFNSALVPQLVEGPSLIPVTEHLFILSGIVPMGLVVVFRNIMAPSLFMPLVAALGSVLGAYVLNIHLNVESDPFIAIVPMLGVVAAGVRFWPQTRLREPIVAILLATAIMQTMQVMRFTMIPETREWRQAALATDPGTAGPTAETAAFLSSKSGVMLDTERNPELVIAMGGVSQLIIAGEPIYDWALEGGLPQAPFIVVPKIPPEARIRDRILLRFPQLRQDGLAGYDMIHDNSHWRVFKKSGF